MFRALPKEVSRGLVALPKGGGILFGMTFKEIIRKIIIAGLFLVPFIPLIVSNWFYFPFITGKNFGFRILVEALFGCWVLLALLDKQYRPRRSWLLAASTAFLFVVLVADALGQNSFKAFWSNFERMEGGITIIHLFAYFVVLSSVASEKIFARLAATSLGVSVIIGIYGLLQIAGVLTIHQGGVRVDATLGNATYLAAYMLFNIFLALFMLVRGKCVGYTKWSLWGVIILDTVILFFTATRGTILGLLGGLLLTSLIILTFGKNVSKMARKGSLVAVIGVLVVLAGLFVAKDVPAIKNNEIFGRLSSISLDAGQTRFDIWNLAWQGFQERPILGWGQEGFNFVFNKYYDPHLYGQEPWFDRAHNVFLDWLIAGGSIGLLAYLSLFAVALWYLVFKKEQSLSLTECALLIGLLAGYFFHNLFVFDNITTSILFMSVLAYLAYIYEGKHPPVSSFEIDSRTVIQIAAPGIAVATLGLIYFLNWPGMATAYALIQSITPHNAGITENITWMQRAESYQSIGRQEVAENLLQASIQIAQSKLATQEQTQQIATLARVAMQQEVDRNPTDARLRIFFGSFLRQFGDFTAAEEQLTKAHELSPGKQAIIYEQGVLKLSEGDKGSALAIFKEAYDLAPESETSCIYYAVMLIESGNNALADQILTQKFGTVIIDNSFLLNAYIETKQYDRVVAIAELRVKNNPNNTQDLMQLADAYRLDGRINDALSVAERVGTMDPTLKATVDQFKAQIQSGK